MKKTAIITFCIMASLFLASCGQDDDHKTFVGTWGVEKIEYYNIDYAGNPIASSMVTYVYDADDVENGIQLVFRADKTGEMRDSDRDTIWTSADTYIVNPDTTIVAKFDYSYDKRESTLYLNMEYVKTFKMKVSDLTSDHFTYETEYFKDYMERAYLKRLSSNPASKSATRQGQGRKRPSRPGSLLSGR